MKIDRRFPAALLVLAVSLAVTSTTTWAADVPPSETQLVRLLYVEGDVRFNRGDTKGPNLQKPWETAEANLPIEQGYALATGAGRAEVEFESGAMVYLAPNSVLLFTELTSTSGHIETRIELVTGTLTTNIQANPQEDFVIRLPSGQIEINYPESSYIRIDSYLDGMAITPQADAGSSMLPNGNSKLELKKGQTVVFKGDKPMQIEGAGQSPGSSDWDTWVAAQVAERNAATEAGLKASGLSSPIPGLADLYTEGEFYACAPYGTCWQPKESPSNTQGTASVPQKATAAAGASAAVPAQVSHAGGAATSTVASASQLPGQNTSGAPAFVPRELPFLLSYAQCPYPTETVTSAKATTQEEYDKLVALYNERSEFAQEVLSGWTVCHFGKYFERGGNYHVVILHKKHRHPVRWVKQGKQVGFVLPHPRDEQGKPPVNLRHGIFLAPAKPGGEVVLAAYNPKAKTETQSTPPKEFRAASFPEMAKATPPEIQARRVEDPSYDAKKGEPAGGRPKITYDYDSKKFVEQGVTVDGHTEKPVVVAELNSSGETKSSSRVSKTVFGEHSNQEINQGGRSSSGGVSGGRGGGSAGKSGNGSGGNATARSSGGGSGGGGYSGGGGRSSSGGYSGGGESRGGGSGGGYSGGGGASGGNSGGGSGGGGESGGRK